MVQRAHYCRRALQDCFKPLEKRQSTRHSEIFLRAKNKLVVLKNSIEHAEPLLIASVQFQYAPEGLSNFMRFKGWFTRSAFNDPIIGSDFKFL